VNLFSGIISYSSQLTLFCSETLHKELLTGIIGVFMRHVIFNTLGFSSVDKNLIRLSFFIILISTIASSFLLGLVFEDIANRYESAILVYRF
jgi:uncharacterized membrane protein YeaQ/YmgE (transglycosylase-associated protein family)